MKPLDIHEPSELFEYVRLEDSVPERRDDRIDVALLDMNHSWPNVGHDSIIHAIAEGAESFHDELAGAGVKVRVLSFDVRRRLLLPESPNGRFRLYVGTGGPGHLDPRLNDGVSEFSQGISEDPSWEAPLFRLFDDIHKHDEAALVGICHSFGLMCRWSGVARAELRNEKSSGMPLNMLTDDGASHPFFREFANELADRRHFRVVDNRLFDLVVDKLGSATPIATEHEESHGLTMVELARHADGTPRMLGVNHHPEIVDREHILAVLAEKRAHGEVSETWYRERAETMSDLFHGERERQSRMTSHYTLLEPLRRHIGRLVAERCSAVAR
ncbi:MAG TPA: hypothetical protein VJ032_10790 [Thermoanaerobaculia bacterium]|nr:hypothetical protein [Thermoanaerobaculia bacterium]